MKVVFFGTPHFAANVLNYLLEHQVHVAAVVTRPDKPKGRSDKLIPTPVKQIALNHGLPVHQPVKASQDDFADILRSYQADLFVIVAYGEIVKQHILDMPKLGCINLHTSVLPKYRGAAPIQRAVMDGEEETGISIMYMVKKMDAGDIISCEKVAIGPNETFGELEGRLCEKGAEMMLDVVQRFAKEGSVDGTAQDEEKVTFAPKVELEDCEVNWSISAQSIHNLIRGAQPYPGAWCWVKVKDQKKRMKLKKSKLSQEVASVPGEVLRVDKEGLLITCGEGALVIEQLQLEGKKPMTPEELFRGTEVQF